MLLVNLIYVCGSFFESILLGNEIIGDLKCLGKDTWKIRRFRNKKNEDEKLEFLFDKP